MSGPGRRGSSAAQLFGGIPRAAATRMVPVILLLAVSQLSGTAATQVDVEEVEKLGRYANVSCGEALVACTDSDSCYRAYYNYVYACTGVLTGEVTDHCPTSCQSALQSLLQNEEGRVLESCNCTGPDEQRCTQLRQKVEICRPTLYEGSNASRVVGCTEATQICSQSEACVQAKDNYLVSCSQLFNGLECSQTCMDSINHFYSQEEVELLQNCVCDGPERPICVAIKNNMERLCHGNSGGREGGNSNSENQSGPTSTAPTSLHSTARTRFLSLGFLLTLVSHRTIVG
ncbi:growth arrest-specific protein 1-like [Branchiostoma lanceolatum]